MSLQLCSPALQAKFAACRVLVEALLCNAIARLMADTCEIQVEGRYLRVEHIQDTNGAWLEPHRDVLEKLFSMVVYLLVGPHSAHWDTDIYDASRKWAGRVAGPATGHGFELRPIAGVRWLIKINDVQAEWRDRHQLAFPDRPISARNASS